MEGCEKLTEARKEVEKEEMEEWWTPLTKQKEREKEEEENAEKLASFFGTVYEILNPVPVPALSVLTVNGTISLVIQLFLLLLLLLFPPLSRLLLFQLFFFPERCLCHLHHALTLKPLRPMTSIGRPEASNTRAPS